jgi:uncharacterized membrane protein
MLQDFLYAIRSLRRSPLVTIADQVLLRLIPVKHARQLVSFTSSGPQSGMVWGENPFSYPIYRDFRDCSP